MSPCDAMAAELRRVTAERDALRALLRGVLPLVEWCGNKEAAAGIRAALALGEPS